MSFIPSGNPPPKNGRHVFGGGGSGRLRAFAKGTAWAGLLYNSPSSSLLTTMAAPLLPHMHVLRASQLQIDADFLEFGGKSRGGLRLCQLGSLPACTGNFVHAFERSKLLFNQAGLFRGWFDLDQLFSFDVRLGEFICASAQRSARRSARTHAAVLSESAQPC